MRQHRRILIRNWYWKIQFSLCVKLWILGLKDMIKIFKRILAFIMNSTIKLHFSFDLKNYTKEEK